MESRSMREDFLSGSLGLRVEGEVLSLRRQGRERMGGLVVVAVAMVGVGRAGCGRREGRGRRERRRGEVLGRRILGSLSLRCL